MNRQGEVAKASENREVSNFNKTNQDIYTLANGTGVQLLERGLIRIQKRKGCEL